MQCKWFGAGALATAGMLAFALPVRAGDTHRLSMPSRTSDAPTVGLVDAVKGADTVSVGGHGGGGHGGGYHGGGYHGGGYHGGGYRGGYGGYHGHGGYGGYHGGYGRGYYGGYGFGRGYYRGYGYGRGYYGGYGYRRGYYGGYGYYPYNLFYGYGYYPSYSYDSYYQPDYYSTPSLYDYSTPSYGIDPYLFSSAGASGRMLSLTINTTPTIPRRIVEIVAAPSPVQSDDQTYPYDGGPRNPAPMPKAEPTPDARPSAAPAEDHAASLPAKVASKLVYPAYGEQATLPGAPLFLEHGVVVKRTK
jgi:hypothetical protein